MALLLLQIDTYLTAAAKYGLEVVAIVVMAVVFWKFFVGKLWPRLLQQADEAQKRLDEQTRSFMAELAAQRKEFLNALSEGRVAAEIVFSEHREMIHTQQNLLTKITDTLNRVEEQTRPQQRRK